MCPWDIPGQDQKGKLMLNQDAIWSLGAMTGTSLDGIDAALVQTDGHEILEFGKTAYRPWSDQERATIASGFGHWQGDPGMEDLSEMIETAHAEVLSQFGEAELIGFHGQTLSHDPDNGRTHQCGNGQVLAEVLNTPVIWDFRSADMEMGGQGAPLAPFFHFACAKLINAERPLAFLNLGGVGNLTWVDPSKERPEDDGALLAFDTGPANAPINDLMYARRGLAFDEDGALASEGEVDEGLVEDFLQYDYFFREPPKSLDRNDFPDLLEMVEILEDADACATLTAIAAASAARGLRHCPVMPEGVFVTGGGRKNPTLMALLAILMDCPVAPIEDAGLDGDMLEAQAFAYLAVRVQKGLPTSAAGTTGTHTPVVGGRLAKPRAQARRGEN